MSSRSIGDKKRILSGYDTYSQLCVTCHGIDMKGAKTDDGTFIAPSLMGSARVNGDKQTLSKIILNGLIGPIEGKEYGIMLPLKDNSDNYIADVLGYVRALNESSLVSRHEVRNARKQTKDTRDAYWTLEEQLKKEESKLRLD